jgi:transposase/phage gp37-like protein
MAKTFRPWNPEQNEMFPPSPLDLVEKDDLVHLVRNLVLEQLDLEEILGQYQEERGHPPFHPVMMTGLILYSYSQRIYSTRRMARACQQRVDFMALTGMQKPDFRTIHLFRQRHLQALGRLFGQVLRVCAKSGLVKLGHVALDGTRIKANANKRKGMTYSQMKKAETGFEAEVRRWFTEADRIDREEDALYGPDKSGDEMPEWMGDKQERMKRIQQAKAELEAEAKEEAQRGPDPDKTRHEKKPTGKPAETAHRNFTDSESRLMKTPDGFIQGYNAQVAVDSQNQIIVAQTLTQSSNDMHQMIPLLKQIRTHLGRQAREVSADAGYCSKQNLKALVQRHIRGYVATDRQRKDRNVSRWVQQMRQRLAQGARRSRYRLRMQIVEPVFGQIKHVRGFRQFLLRGKTKVAAEWSLICTAHNLLKLAAARS